MLSAAHKQQLDELGYLVLPDLLPAPRVAELRDRVEALWTAEGDDAGSEFRLEPGTRRLANLVDKGDIFAELIVMPEILECVAHVIGPDIKLSSFNARGIDSNHRITTSLASITEVVNKRWKNEGVVMCAPQ